MNQPLVERVYSWLRGDLDPKANRILAAGLSHAEPEYVSRIANILLERRHESAWTGLVANYDRLPADAQKRLLDNPGLLRAGIAGAMKSRTPDARRNALALLAEHPCPKLSYAVADALRDPAPAIREAASDVLRQTAELMLSDGTPLDRPTPAQSADALAARQELVQALREALRTYELHHQVDVIETCLWFAKDLGEGLWEALSANRSQCGHVVEQHLQSWNHPRLASFLLLALGQSPWRQMALALLNAWGNRSELIALLRSSDLLLDPDVRHNLQRLKRPRWMAAADPTLSGLPADARAQLPHWVCHLGFSPQERLRCLRLWYASRLPEVQRSTVYALANLDRADAARLIADVASRPGPMQRFARWYITGKRISLSQRRRPNRTEADTLGLVAPNASDWS